MCVGDAGQMVCWACWGWSWWFENQYEIKGQNFQRGRFLLDNLYSKCSQRLRRFMHFLGVSHLLADIN